MAETSEKLAKVAARILSGEPDKTHGQKYTHDEVMRLAGSVLRQKEKKERKKALRSVGVV